jgi:UDP-N-acetylglucosamine--N-acetylmuramyl-(pentapeptide) pyrophosphoryl-undecaprenol N-acetylglucosamine transferase
MKIVLTGGGTGGHFYPLIAVAEEIHRLCEESKIIEPKVYYMGPDPYDSLALAENDIEFIRAAAGKVRRYASLLNFLDSFKILFGIIESIWQMYKIYPDVVFSKGGYAAFPTLVACRILAIPVVVHESDASVGRANMYAAKFAKAIAISYPGTEELFPKKVRDRIALTGNPIRSDIAIPAKEGGHTFMSLSSEVPTVLVMGGSSGAQTINSTLLNALPELVARYNVVHQTGRELYEEVEKISTVVLKDNPHKDRYKYFAFLNPLALRMASGIANVFVSRAGSNAIFETAAWGIPSIIIPIPEDVSHDQTKNAFTYARAGACVVIEQKNLTPHILVSEIDRIVNTKEVRDEMSRKAREFARPDAAEKIARTIMEIALEHEE